MQSKTKQFVFYSTLNLRFAHVLSQIGIHSEAGSEANLNLNCTVHITNCKEAIIVDIYLLLRSILWNVLFFHERNVLEKTQKMTSRDTMHNTDNASVVRGIALDRVNHLFLVSWRPASKWAVQRAYTDYQIPILYTLSLCNLCCCTSINANKQAVESI